MSLCYVIECTPLFNGDCFGLFDSFGFLFSYGLWNDGKPAKPRCIKVLDDHTNLFGLEDQVNPLSTGKQRVFGDLQTRILDSTSVYAKWRSYFSNGDKKRQHFQPCIISDDWKGPGWQVIHDAVSYCNAKDVAPIFTVVNSGELRWTIFLVFSAV